MKLTIERIKYRLKVSLIIFYNIVVNYHVENFKIYHTMFYLKIIIYLYKLRICLKNNTIAL